MVGGRKVVETRKMDFESDRVADYLTIGDVTIAVPKGCPIGLAFKHPDDAESKITGQAIAFQRLINETVRKSEESAMEKKLHEELKNFFKKL